VNDDLIDARALDQALDGLYGDISLSAEEVEARLRHSLNPRGADMLYDKIGALGLSQAHYLLDTGCRDAAHTCELARRYACRALGIDPIAHNLDKARKLIAGSGQAGRVSAVEGRIEAIPAGDHEFDFIWCRDMLNHVPDLRAGLAECTRVLKPAGKMLVYQTFVTDLLELREAASLYPPLAVVEANMSTDHFETACRDTGLRIVERDMIASEWREHWEETGEGRTSRQLLWIARLRRDRARLIAELGPTVYGVELANCYWGVYQMLGKLCPMLYVLER
jgi:sarcosine/dimethylglycine N-methyltransferase